MKKKKIFNPKLKKANQLSIYKWVFGLGSHVQH